MKTRSLAALTAAAALIALNVTGVAGIANAATATVASPQSTHVVPYANDCGLPTKANPGSAYNGGYSNCHQCEAVAILLSFNNQFHYTFYCTYNPSNGLSDLHHDL